MDVKVKKLSENAVIPKYAKEGDAGLDLTATSVAEHVDTMGGHYYVEYGTGLAFEIPEGHVGLVFPRSSISKTALILANAVGVVDSNYRGEVKARFKLDAGVVMSSKNPDVFKVGDRIAQLVILPYPTINLVESQELSETNRQDGAFGSTGK
jgi:dUTP pyrophosphatase